MDRRGEEEEEKEEENHERYLKKLWPKGEWGYPRCNTEVRMLLRDRSSVAKGHLLSWAPSAPMGCCNNTDYLHFCCLFVCLFWQSDGFSCLISRTLAIPCLPQVSLPFEVPFPYSRTLLNSLKSSLFYHSLKGGVSSNLCGLKNVSHTNTNAPYICLCTHWGNTNTLTIH